MFTSNVMANRSPNCVFGKDFIRVLERKFLLTFLPLHIRQEWRIPHAANHNWSNLFTFEKHEGQYLTRIKGIIFTRDHTHTIQHTKKNLVGVSVFAAPKW